MLLIAGFVFFGVLPDVVGERMNRVIYPPPYEATSQARTLHDSILVADLHGDSLLWNRDLTMRGYGQIDIPRLVEGNVALQAFTVVTKVPAGQNIESNPADARDNITLLAISQRWPVATWTSLKARALYQADRLHALERRSGGKLVIVKSAKDLRDVLERRESDPKLVAGFLGIEGLHCLEGDRANIRELFSAGYRMMAPTHFFDNKVAGSAHGVAKGGLTPFGREVVRELEERSILIDLAHASTKTIDDVLEMTSRPVVVSHTGVRGTCDNQRNLSDRHIRGIAETGGVIGIGVWETAVCGASAIEVADAMRYVADLVGVEHVALGTDFDGAIAAPFDVTGLVQVTDALLAQEFSEEDVAAIMGGNTVRVLLDTLPEG